MKKLLILTVFLSLLSSQCILAQTIPTTSTQIVQVENGLEAEDTNQATGYRLQVTGSKTVKLPSGEISHRAQNITNCDNSAGSLNCHLMMDPSTAEDGIKAIEKVLRTSEQNAAIAEGTIVEHQATGVIAEIKETPVASVSSGSNEVEIKRFSNASSRILKSEKKSDNSEEFQDPDLESEDVQSMNSQVNKYLKNEIINNIYTECLAEVAKFSLGGRVTAENALEEAAEWAAAKAAAEYYIRKYERESRVCGREENKAKEIAEVSRRKAEIALTVSKKAKELDQLEAKVVLARAAYAESDYELKKLALQLAEARVGTAHATLYAIEVKNNPSRSTVKVELAECQKIEFDALDAFTKAKADLETKAALLGAAEEALTVAKHQGFSTGAKSATNEEAESTENMKASGEVESVAEASIIRSIEPPVLSDDIAEKIGRRLLGKVVEEQETQALQESTLNLEDEARWDAREKADQLSKELAVARSHMKRWQKKYASSWENPSALVSLETRSRADSTASVESALGSIDDLEEGKVEENIDPEVAAEQKRQRLLEEITQIEQARNAEEEKWEKNVEIEMAVENGILALEATIAKEKEGIRHPAIKLPDRDKEEDMKRWMEQDRAAIEKRAAKKKAAEMKAYCAANAERWMVCAEIEKLKKEANTAALNSPKLLADLRMSEKTAKKRWSDLAYHEKSVIEALSKNTMSAEEALKELQKRDNVVCQLWTSMIPSSEEEFHVMTKAGIKLAKKEVLPGDYFQEVEDTQNLAKEVAATKQYAKAIKQEALQQALIAVLEGKESSIKALWNSKLVESAVAARQATLLAQRPLHPDWKTDEPRRMAQRTINSAKAHKAAFDAFHQELERFNGIKMVWMARLEEAAQSHAEGDPTAWNRLTEEERNVYNAITIAKNNAKGEAIQKEIEEAKQEAEKAHRQVGEAWISSTKVAREAIAKATKEKVEKMRAAEKERQEAIRWAKKAIAKKVEAELERMKVAEMEKKEALRWAKLTPEERILKLNERKPKRVLPEEGFLTIRNLETGEECIIGESDPDFDFSSFELSFPENGP